jgi:hypothetical protein
LQFSDLYDERHGSIESGVVDDGVANLPVPEIHRELAGDDVRGMNVFALHDSQRVSSLGVSHGASPRVLVRRFVFGSFLLMENIFVGAARLFPLQF